MTAKLKKIITDTREKTDWLLNTGIAPLEEDLKFIKNGFEAVVQELEKKSANHNGTQLGKEAKVCLDYYFDRHVELHKIEPIIDGGRDMKIFMAILKKYDVEAVKETLDTFLEYTERLDYTLPTFRNRFPVLYLRNKRIAEGRK
jgi:hypothetical protein